MATIFTSKCELGLIQVRFAKCRMEMCFVISLVGSRHEPTSLPGNVCGDTPISPRLQVAPICFPSTDNERELDPAHSFSQDLTTNSEQPCGVKRSWQYK